jgi:hypothetical protein
MTTASLGFAPYNSFMNYSYASSSHTCQNTRSSSSIDRTGLPSPPGSNRTSIDSTAPKAVSGQSQTPHIDAVSGPILTSIHATTLPSPPQSRIGDSPRTSSIDNIVLKLRPFLESREGEYEVDGVNAAFLDDINAYMLRSDQAGLWQSLR